MLPVVIVGENLERMQYIGQSMPMAQCVPLRNIKFNHMQDHQHIPALAAPSIVVLDVGVENNQEIGNYIKRFKMTYPDSAVLVLIGFGDASIEQACIDNGADDVLSRPMSVTRLSLTLRNLSELVNHRTNISDRHNNVSVLHMKPEYVHLLEDDGVLKRLHHIEQEIIQFAVNYCHGHISNTAKALGIGRSTLYRKLDAMQTRQRFEQRVLNKHDKIVDINTVA